MLTQERLKEVLLYNPLTGEFIWKLYKAGVTYNSVAGAKHCKGYIRIRVDGVSYLAHRLVWLYVTGSWPLNQIDHANGNRTDNRFYNLREATATQQKGNTKLYGNNKSGFRGVFWDKRACKWIAKLGKKYLGSFGWKEDAARAYNDAAVKFYGSFAQLNNVGETRTKHTFVTANLEDFNG